MTKYDFSRGEPCRFRPGHTEGVSVGDMVVCTDNLRGEFTQGMSYLVQRSKKGLGVVSDQGAFYSQTHTRFKLKVQEEDWE